MKPEIIKQGEFIEVIGHYSDTVLCAKMTLLADLYAVEHRNGYAKFKVEDAENLKAVDERLEFTPEVTFYFKSYDGADIYYSCSTNDYNCFKLTSDGIYCGWGSPDYKVYSLADISGASASANGEITISLDTSYNMGAYMVNEAIFIKTQTGLTASIKYNGAEKATTSGASIPITYNGTTVATITEAGTKTLEVEGCLMAHNIVVGDKTLNTAGCLMQHDIVIETSGGSSVELG